VLPLRYYKPFKAAALYIKHRFANDPIAKSEEMIDFEHKFWYSEKYFDQTKMEDYFYSDSEYTKFKGFLNARCYLYPISFMIKNNLFLLHYVFNDFKIAINFHLNKLIPEENSKPTEMMKLS
jgi:hypothetical protein